VGSNGRAIGIDRDPAAIARLEATLAHPSVQLICASYGDLPELLRQLDLPRVDGVLLDLGVSSDQLADPQRGFSFQVDAPLDLRFNPQSGEPAWRMLDRLSDDHLAQLIHEYGEERYSRRIGRAIVAARRRQPIRSTLQLAEIIRKCVPSAGRKERIDPATRTFQALRIAVNAELQVLATALRRIPDCLNPGGRLVIISFHSLEDRQVKQAFRHDGRLENLTRKPIRPGEEEVRRNPRSRSAKLRAARRH
jgi:16S rRNA (cytosine1402-N4)-methyltransferase